MIAWLLNRLISLVPVTLGVVTIVFLFIHLIPGDPTEKILGPYATLEDRQELASELGLDQPLWKQLTTYFGNLAQGNLGESLYYDKSVMTLIKERYLPTLELAIVSLLVALLISFPLGLLSAIKSGGWIDHTSMFFALLGVCIPNYWLGPMLILFFSIGLGWLPVSERAGILSYVLPSITLGTALAAITTRMIRTSVIDNLKEDYVRTARAKGLEERIILLKHVLKNSLLPVVTIVGLQLGVLLTGSIITEKIFDWPGLGTLMLESIGNRDYPVVQGCVLCFSMTYVLTNLFVDILYSFVDPRIRYGS